jgi:hypothetical protein
MLRFSVFVLGVTAALGPLVLLQLSRLAWSPLLASLVGLSICPDVVAHVVYYWMH